MSYSWTLQSSSYDNIISGTDDFLPDINTIIQSHVFLSDVNEYIRRL